MEQGDGEASGAVSSRRSQESGWRRRATALGLTLLAEVFFLIMLLGLNPALLPKREPPPEPVLIDIAENSQLKQAPKPKSVAKAKAAPKAAATPIRAPRPVPLPPRPPTVRSPSFFPLSHSDLAAADISKLGTAASGGKSDAQSASVAGPGEGPGGAHLYKAEWYVEPSDAQINNYLPKSGVDRGSWAEIACKTISHYHVENCQPLGESPLGSGLARAMRLAAWQFLVRPPNVDGKPLVGSWVRIRITFSKESDAAG